MKSSKNKASANFSMDKEMLEKVRDMIYWTPGLSLSTYLEHLIEKDIEAYEKEHGPIERQEDFYFKVSKK